MLYVVCACVCVCVDDTYVWQVNLCFISLFIPIVIRTATPGLHTQHTLVYTVLQAAKALAGREATGAYGVHLAVQRGRIIVETFDLNGADSLGVWRRHAANS